MDTNDVIIDFQNVEIKQEKKIILKNVYFQLKKSEFVYLIGNIGSGKTSFIKTINAELPLSVGNGRVIDFDLKKIKKKKIPFLRRKIGIVFQDYQLLTDRNVYQNLVFVLKATGWKSNNEIKKRIHKVLMQTSMEKFIYEMPFELSGGEQQRIVIARALLNSPDIILADEPTGNLDNETAFSLVKLLMDITSNGTGIIMATHHHDLLENYPARIVRCENGRLIEQNQ